MGGQRTKTTVYLEGWFCLLVQASLDISDYEVSLIGSIDAVLWNGSMILIVLIAWTSCTWLQKHHPYRGISDDRSFKGTRTYIKSKKNNLLDHYGKVVISISLLVKFVTSLKTTHISDIIKVLFLIFSSITCKAILCCRTLPPSLSFFTKCPSVPNGASSRRITGGRMPTATSDTILGWFKHRRIVA